jgi:hypothetical protein
MVDTQHTKGVGQSPICPQYALTRINIPCPQLITFPLRSSTWEGKSGHVYIIAFFSSQFPVDVIGRFHLSSFFKSPLCPRISSVRSSQYSLRQHHLKIRKKLYNVSFQTWFLIYSWEIHNIKNIFFLHLEFKLIIMSLFGKSLLFYFLRFAILQIIREKNKILMSHRFRNYPLLLYYFICNLPFSIRLLKYIPDMVLFLFLFIFL